ncbi:MAG: two-component sensor histidine kinase [Deltaproteobacteria bacterium]|nr:MAG: two-component sensor histidine kinase [Deltaproteobacteria bacterium]
MSPTAPIDAPSHGTRRARWGMLVTTLVMGVALVVTGVTTFLSNRAAADAVADARAMDLYHGVRRSLRDAADALDATLVEILEESSEQGLRYVAIVGPEGELLATAGEPVAKGAPSPLPPGPPRAPAVMRVGDRVRIDAATMRPRRRAMGRMPGARVIIEVEPVMARELAETARNHLLVSAVAAVLLLILALFFWRTGARADRAEAQLARDRRLAALGEMSAVLGHELRNPLASLKGHAQLVLERTDPEARGYKNAQRVVREAERLETLTRQILDFARTGTLSRGAVDPGALLRAAAEQAGDGRVRIDTATAPERWDLDEDRMNQVLVNLVKNAVQASPEGAEVDARCALDGAAVVFTVRDRGEGFPPGEAESAFEPFRTSRVQGTGLGLPIARRIVEAHGGTIEALNAADGGAVVRVRIPAAESTT